MLRIARALSGLALVVSGVLMYAASAERWSGYCESWAGPYDGTCGPRTDHLYDFLPPAEPWVPTGASAELAGLSVLLLAAVLAVLPWVLTGRAPGRFTALAALVVVPASVATGVGILRSGWSGEVVDPLWPGITFPVWTLGQMGLVILFAVQARGWSRASMAALALGLPMSAYFTYAVGSWDAAPWWEAICGTWTAVAGLGLVVAALGRRTDRSSAPQSPETPGALVEPGASAVPAVTH